jgi:hypothetical protein
MSLFIYAVIMYHVTFCKVLHLTWSGMKVCRRHFVCYSIKFMNVDTTDQKLETLKGGSCHIHAISSTISLFN